MKKKETGINKNEWNIGELCGNVWQLERQRQKKIKIDSFSFQRRLKAQECKSEELQAYDTRRKNCSQTEPT